MLLPYRLHIDSLTVIQGHGSHKIIRKLFILFQIMLLHIVFHDLCIHFIIYICTMKRLGLAHIVVGVYRLDPSRNSQHGRQCACRRYGKKLRISQAIFIYQLSGLLCSICLEERGRHNFFHIAFWKSSLFLCQFCRSCNGCVCHGKSDLITHFHSVLFPIGEPQLQESVSQSHNSQADLSPLFYAVPLLL